MFQRNRLSITIRIQGPEWQISKIRLAGLYQKLGFIYVGLSSALGMEKQKVEPLPG
jgi:hypothetical protein